MQAVKEGKHPKITFEQRGQAGKAKDISAFFGEYDINVTVKAGLSAPIGIYSVILVNENLIDSSLMQIALADMGSGQMKAE